MVSRPQYPVPVLAYAGGCSSLAWPTFNLTFHTHRRMLQPSRSIPKDPLLGPLKADAASQPCVTCPSLTLAKGCYGLVRRTQKNPYENIPQIRLFVNASGVLQPNLARCDPNSAPVCEGWCFGLQSPSTDIWVLAPLTTYGAVTWFVQAP